MTEEDLRVVFENYLAAFAASSLVERESLLRSSVAEDVTYTNPGVDGKGLRSMLAHIEAFQARFPGGCFRMNWLRQQHGQVLSEWTQLDKDGSALVTAHSYARLNEQGRIAHLAGFWAVGAV